MIYDDVASNLSALLVATFIQHIQQTFCFLVSLARKSQPCPNAVGQLPPIALKPGMQAFMSYKHLLCSHVHDLALEYEHTWHTTANGTFA